MRLIESLVPAVCSLALANFAGAQCNDFGPAFGALGVDNGGGNADVAAQLVWDDGRGPALYIAGRFEIAGDAPATNIARWDGTRFESVGDAAFDTSIGSYIPRINALAVFDDGSGPALYAGGRFSSISGLPASGLAKWDGQQWSVPMGGNLSSTLVHVLAAYDDGSGSKLYVGGNFTSIGGHPFKFAARWTGAAWEDFTGGTFNEPVYAFQAHDDGSGLALFIAGDLGYLNPKVRKWNGTTLEYMPSTPTYTPCCGTVRALTTFDDGSGAKLYAGGYFQPVNQPPTNNVAVWDGASWTQVGSGLTETVVALRGHDDGGGPALYALSSTPVGRFCRLAGGAWLDQGSSDDALATLAEFDAGAGAELFVGGALRHFAGVAVDGIARWSGGQAAPLTNGFARRTRIHALASHDHGAGALLHADRTDDGPDEVDVWDGASWSALGGGANGGVTTLASLDLGAGAELYAGGTFTAIGASAVNGVARWNGSAWDALGDGITGGAHDVHVLARHDPGSGALLVAGGDFTTAGSGAANNLAAWDGASWSAIGGNVNGLVSAVATFDSGAGPELYIGGGFTQVAGVTAYSLARWNGSAWSSVGGGINGHVYSLVVFDDGSGPVLYVAGDINGGGAMSHQDLARWDGTQWSAVPGTALGVRNLALVSHDDGSGPTLFAGGRLSNTEGYLMRWNGAGWTSLGEMEDDVRVLASHVTTSGARELWAGGDFVRAGSVASARIARWGASWTCAPASYCTAGTTSSGCVPAISGIGTPSASAASGFTIRVDALEGQKTGHVFYGLNGAVANPWSPLSSSYLCVKAPSQRTGTQNSGGTNGACDGVIQLDWNAYCATHPTSLGVPFTAGAQVWSQLYFRDPAAAKTTNLSGGLTFFVAP